MDKTMLALAAVAMMGAATVAAAPAPPLSYLQIRYVGSSNIGWEPIADSQFSTAQDHGGAQLRVLTVEVGYGTNAIAKINGVILPASANYATMVFCGSDFLAPCSAGQTIVGYMRYWNVDGYQRGTFYYQSTSINSPFNTMSDTLTVLRCIAHGTSTASWSRPVPRTDASGQAFAPVLQFAVLRRFVDEVQAGEAAARSAGDKRRPVLGLVDRHGIAGGDAGDVEIDRGVAFGRGHVHRAGFEVAADPVPGDAYGAVAGAASTVKSSPP